MNATDQSVKRKRGTRAKWRAASACAWCAVLLVLLSGCHRPDTLTTNDGFLSPLTTADITYDELVQRYNAAIEPMATLWSRADVDIEWIEEDSSGDRRFRSESGNGKFIMRRTAGPADTAITVEKLGKIYLWAGSNAENYYLFDRVDGDNKTLYVGEHRWIAQSKAFPLPIHPSMVPTLLGLAPLPAEPSVNSIDRYGDDYLLSLPELGMRMLIDPVTFRPKRVDLTDAKGFSVLIAKLSGVLLVDGPSDGGQPILCDKAEIYVAGIESRFTLDFSTATTSTRRIKDQMFDLDALSDALKPDRTVDLDE